MATATDTANVTSDWTLLATGKSTVMIEYESGAECECRVAAALPSASARGHRIKPVVTFNGLDTGADNVYVRTAGGVAGSKATIVYTAG